MTKEALTPSMNRRLNALRTGTYSQEPVLPGEDPDEIARDAEQLIAEIRPRSRVAIELTQSAVRNRLLSKRCRRGIDLMIKCHPVARAIATLQRSRSVGVEEAVRQLIQEPYDALAKIEDYIESLPEHEPGNNKARKRIADDVERIAKQLKALDTYFLGLGELVEKDQRRMVELDVTFIKQWNAIRVAQEMEAEHELLLKAKGITHHAPSSDGAQAEIASNADDVEFLEVPKT